MLWGQLLPVGHPDIAASHDGADSSAIDMGTFLYRWPFFFAYSSDLLSLLYFAPFL